MRAPFPPNEIARLQALHDLRVLESPVDDRFDEIVRLAAQLCDAPMAAITLVDGDRLWAKARSEITRSRCRATLRSARTRSSTTP